MENCNIVDLVSRRKVFYAEAVYDEFEIEAVIRVLRTRHLELINGPAVREFEGRVAALFGKTHGVMTNSGSSANTLAVSALDLPPGAEVITPACTFGTTVAPLVQQGLVPAFVDVEPGTYQIDVHKVEAAVTSQTRAMMIPNLIGNLPDWPRLRQIADAHGLRVIEDSADTLGGLIEGRPIGSLSDVSTTSFYATHVITCAGFGGMACFNDPDLARRALLLRGWGRRSTLKAESEEAADRFSAVVDGIPYDAKFTYDGVGYNFLPSEVAAAFGLEQLKKLGAHIEARIRNFDRLSRFFTAFEHWLVLPRQTAATRTAWLAVPLVVRDSAPFTRRDLQVYFEAAGVQTRPVFAGNILRHQGFAGIACRTVPGGYPVADSVMRGGILLGCHHAMGEEDSAYICDVFTRFVAQY